MKKKNLIQFVIVIIILAIAIFKWTRDSDNDTEIDKNLKICVGEIYDINSTFPENHHVKYRYQIKGTNYEAKMQANTFSKKCTYEKFDKFKVEYSSINPQKSRIVLNCKLSDTLKLSSPPELVSCNMCD